MTLITEAENHIVMRNLALLAARILISATLLYLALRGIDFASVRARLSDINLGWFAASIGLTLIQVMLGAWRWIDISAGAGAPLGAAQTARFNLIGTFFNQTLPSTIGGDAMRLWLVKQTGAGWRNATYSVLVDRAIGFIALALIVIVSLPLSYQLIANPRGRLALELIGVGAIAASAGFLALTHCPAWIAEKFWPLQHIHACSQIANGVLFDIRRGPRIIVISLLVHLMTVAIAWCVTQSIAATAGFDQLFLLIPPIMLITMVPISIAGWGVREATMMVAFGYAGLAAADGTIVSLLFGASSFVVGIVGGLVWIASAEKAMPPEAPEII